MKRSVRVILIAAIGCLFSVGSLASQIPEEGSALPLNLESGDQPTGHITPPPTDGVIPAKIFRYAERLIARRDRDGDLRLNRREWGQVWGFLMADVNLDGMVNLDELVRRVASYGQHRRIRLMPPPTGPGDLLPPLLNPTTRPPSGETRDGRPGANKMADILDGPTGPERKDDSTVPNQAKLFVAPTRLREKLPGWFLDRDADGDGQLTMAEFAPTATPTTLADFARYDANGDGLITAAEYLDAAKSN